MHTPEQHIIVARISLWPIMKIALMLSALLFCVIGLGAFLIMLVVNKAPENAFVLLVNYFGLAAVYTAATLLTLVLFCLLYNCVSKVIGGIEMVLIVRDQNHKR